MSGPYQSGSPAYAGIDPAMPTATLGIRRFPRIRGDRPLHPDVAAKKQRVPPHTRG